MMAKKKAKVPTLSASAERLSGDAICTGWCWSGVCWLDGERLVTLDGSGKLVRWHRTGVREEVMELGREGLAGLQRLDARRVVARAGTKLWVVDAQAWTVLATITGICEAYTSVILGSERVVTSWPWGVVVYVWEGESLREVMRIEDEQLNSVRHSVCKMAPGLTWLTAAYDGRVVLIDMTRGAWRELAGVERVITLDEDGARGLVWSQGEHGRGLRVVELETGATVAVWGGYMKSLKSGERVEDGWVLRGDQQVYRCDEAGEVRWSWRTHDYLYGSARSPDGARVAVWTNHRVILLDAATGEAEGIEGIEEDVDRLEVIDEPAQVVAMTMRPRYDTMTRAHRWGLDGAYLGGSLWRHATVSAGALYGDRDMSNAAQGRQLERWTPSEGAVVVGPIEAIYDGLCVEGGAAFYTVNTGGGWRWALRRGADDGSGWQDQVLAMHRRKEPLYAPLASAGGLVAVLGDAQQVDVYEATTGALRYSLTVGGKHQIRMLFEASGGVLYTVGDAKLHCWDLATGEARWEVKADKRYYASANALSRDGRYLVCASRTLSTLLVYDARTGEVVCEAELDAPVVRAMAFGPDGLLYMACRDTQLYRVELPC